jgi:L-ascorbate metabolism protein UlaG (beta-lactamase superfamily)
MPPSRRSFLRLLALGLAAVALRRQVRAADTMRTTFPLSDHCDGQRFFNPGGGNPRGFKALLRWQFSRHPGTWPAWVENTATPALPASLAPRECAVTFVNHSTFLWQLPGLNLLTDPIWSDRCSPFTWTGPKRVRAPGLAFTALPRIDLVLLTHNHYDHLDLPTLQRLHAAHRPLILTTLGNRAFLARHGIDRVVELDWWQHHEPRPGVKVTVTPAQHFSARGFTDRMETLWGGFALEAPAGRLYFAGDSGYYDGFRAIGERLGPFDLAFLPIGAYEPRWFMEPMHCNPAEAIRIHREVRARRSLAMHFGCFPLADDSYEQPVTDFLAARAAAGLDADEFALPAVGETRVLQFG